MPDRPELSEARRALLEKFLRGEISPTATVKNDAHSNGTPTLAPASTPTVPSTPISLPVEDRDSLRVPVVPIRASGSKRPLFYSHVHVDGGAFYCFTLADRLGSDQPFYILEPYRFDGGALPPRL